MESKPPAPRTSPGASNHAAAPDTRRTPAPDAARHHPVQVRSCYVRLPRGVVSAPGIARDG